jgi:hypothetical protein
LPELLGLVIGDIEDIGALAGIRELDRDCRALYVCDLAAGERSEMWIVFLAMVSSFTLARCGFEPEGQSNRPHLDAAFLADNAQLPTADPFSLVHQQTVPLQEAARQTVE